MQQAKPALILDDQTVTAVLTSQSVRGFGGLGVVHHKSVEQFLRSSNLSLQPTPIELANTLKQYSAIICDNDFHYQGKIKGLDFLVNNIGPASLLISEQERPCLYCFAPSSEHDLRNAEEDLWQQYSIASFNRTHEFPAVGLAVRFSREFGTPFSREMVIEHIFGQRRGDDPMDSPTKAFFQKIFFQFLLDTFRAKDYDIVEGAPCEIEWNSLIDGIAQTMNIADHTLIEKIQHEAEASKHFMEERFTRRKE